MLLGYEPLDIMSYSTTSAASDEPASSVHTEPSSSNSVTYADFTGPIEVTVIQLLPDFDGNFDDFSGDEGREDIISYTSEDIDGMQKEIATDNDSYLDDFFGDPSMLPALGISPAMVQRIRSDSLGKSDYLKLRMEQESDESETEGCVPVLLGRSSPRLSLSQDGFIILNDYKISPDTLGGGKLSEVRIAYGATDETQYAVKIHSKMKLQNYNNLLRSSRNPTEEVYREIEILRQLDHPNIIKLVDVVDEKDDDNLYMVFERLDRELMTIPCDKPLSETDARKYFKDILSGVGYLHKNEIVHRDLKPENMLLSKEGNVKIADFGFCEKMVESPNPKDGKVTSCSSGTPAFTPPECLASFSKPVGGEAMDMWSLGITLYALVVGDVPFKADNVFQLHRSIKEGAITYPPERSPSCVLRDLISRLLTKDPTQRLKMPEVKKHPWLAGETPPTSRRLMSVGSYSDMPDDF